MPPACKQTTPADIPDVSKMSDADVARLQAMLEQRTKTTTSTTQDTGVAIDEDDDMMGDEGDQGQSVAQRTAKRKRRIVVDQEDDESVGSPEIIATRAGGGGGTRMATGIGEYVGNLPCSIGLTQAGGSTRGTMAPPAVNVHDPACVRCLTKRIL